MTSLKALLTDLFTTQEIQQIRIEDVVMGLNDLTVRNHWLHKILDEIQNINTSIDADLLQKKDLDLREKSARRRALQFVLEQVIQSKRAIDGQQRHNPVTGGFATR
jgi:hypothetical protein